MAEWEPFDRRNGGYNLPSDIYPEYSSNKNGQQPNDLCLGVSSELALQNQACYAPINPTGPYNNASDNQPRLSDVPTRLEISQRFRPDVRRVSCDGDPQAVSFLYGGNRASPVGRGSTARYGFDRGSEGGFDYGSYGPNGIGQGGGVGGFESSLFPPTSQAWSYDNAGFYPPPQNHRPHAPGHPHAGRFDSTPGMYFQVRGTSVAARRMNFPMKQASIVSRRMNAQQRETGTGVFIPKIDPIEAAARRRAKLTSTAITAVPKREEERQRQKKKQQPQKELSQPLQDMNTGQSSESEMIELAGEMGLPQDWTYSP